MRQRIWLAVAAALATTVPVTAQLFKEGSYPAEALALGQHGRVTVTLTIASTGAVTACRVVKSSKSRSLDADACKVAMKAKFAPEHDDAGIAIESTFSMKLAYLLPQ